MARRFLKTFGQQAEVKAAETERATGLQTWQQGRPLIVRSGSARAQDVARLSADTYERETWTFRAVNAIASNQSRLRFVVRRDDPIDGAEVAKHPLVSLMNFRPNDWEDRSGFRTRMSGQLLLSPRGVFIEKLLSKGGDLIGVQLLPPQFTTPIPHPTDFVSGYEVNYGSVKWKVEADRVIWLKFHHPLDPYRSLTPAEAAGLTIDTDYLSALYNAKFLRNDGRPGGLVSIKGRMSVQEDIDEVRAWAHNPQPGVWRVIESDGIEAQDFSASPRDAQYIEGREAAKREILAAFGVPGAVIGDVSDQTFANAAESRKMFWIETMPSHLGMLAAGLDLVDGDDRTFAGFDMTGVDVYQEIAASRQEQLVSLFREGIVTIDEVRDEIGRAPFGQPATRALYLGASVAPVATEDGEVDAVTTAADAAERAANPPAPTLTVVGPGEGGAPAPAVGAAGLGPPA